MLTNDFGDSMLYDALMNPKKFIASAVASQLRRGTRKSAVLHQQTCPECGSKLVNLYRVGNEWKCKKCYDKGGQK